MDKTLNLIIAVCIVIVSYWGLIVLYAILKTLWHFKKDMLAKIDTFWLSYIAILSTLFIISKLI